jgi:hypothetical protein
MGVSRPLYIRVGVRGEAGAPVHVRDGAGSAPRAPRWSQTRSWSRRHGPHSDPSLWGTEQMPPGSAWGPYKSPPLPDDPSCAAPRTHSAAAPRAPGSGCTGRRRPRSLSEETIRAVPAWRLRGSLRMRLAVPKRRGLHCHAHVTI